MGRSLMRSKMVRAMAIPTKSSVKSAASDLSRVKPDLARFAAAMAPEPARALVL